MRNYAISLLEAELKKEKEMLATHSPEIKKAKYDLDRAAFTESVRLALERIPPLEKAIQMLRQNEIKETFSCIEYSTKGK